MYIVLHITQYVILHPTYTLYTLYTGQLQFVPGTNGEGSRIDTTGKSTTSQLPGKGETAEYIDLTLHLILHYSTLILPLFNALL